MKQNSSPFDPENFDVEIDAVNLLCPLPVLRARKRLLAMQPFQVLKLEANDPAAIIDVPHFCAQSGHLFLGMLDGGTTQTYFIRRSNTLSEDV